MIKEEYSNYRNISVSFKSGSPETVEGIKFMWYGQTAFKEPADMGGVIEGLGSGFTDKTILSIKYPTLQWSVLIANAKKAVLAWRYEVVFTDGTIWKLN